MLRLLTSVVFLLIIFQTYGQIRVSEFEVLLQSRHVWRGEKLGTGPAIEPSLTVSAGRFSLNCWAALTPNNSYSEIDLIPSFQAGRFQLSLLDYYNPVPGEDNQFLNFREGMNRHSIELTIDNYPVDKRRMKWMIGTFLLGDQNEETGNPYFSTYAEIKFPFTVFGIGIETFTGLTPFRGYYARKFAVVNSGVSFSKELDLKLPFSIPLSLSFITNSYAKQSFVIFAGGIAF